MSRLRQFDFVLVGFFAIAVVVLYDAAGIAGAAGIAVPAGLYLLFLAALIVRRRMAPVPTDPALAGVAAGEPYAVEPAGGERDYLVPRDLPPALSWFVGREAELETTVRHLGRTGAGGAKVIVNQGPAGIGKTSLAVQAAHRVAERFPDGQLFARVNVAANERRPGEQLPDDQLCYEVLGQFITSLRGPGEEVPDSLESRIHRYRELIRRRPRVLIVLDDVDRADLVGTLLPSGDGWAAIVTARAPVTGLRVDTLSMDLGPLAKAECVRLLRLIVGDERVAREPDNARRIVDLTAGHPLSLKVAAGSLADRPYTSLATVFERDGDEALAADAPGADPLGPGLAMLTDDARRAFRLLGLLDGQSFRTWMLAALLETDETSAGPIVDHLLHAGLVERATSDGMGVPTFVVPEPVGRYARELTGRLDEGEQNRLRSLLARARADRERRRPTSELKGSVYQPLIEGRLNEALSGARRAVTLARDTGDRSGEGLALAAFAEVRAELGPFDLAAELAYSALRLGDATGQARAYRCLGRLHRHARQLEAAESQLRSGLQILNSDDTSERLRLYRELAMTQSMAGRPVAARETIDAAFRLCAGLPGGGRQHRPGLLWASSVISQAGERFEDAAAVLAEGERIATGLGQRLWLAWLLHQRARLLLAANDCDRAHEAAYRAVVLFAEMSHRYGKAHCRLLIGDTMLSDGRPDEALPALEEAAENFLSCGDRWAEATATEKLGYAYRDSGRVRDAARLFRTAERIFDELDDAEAVTRVGAARAGLPGGRRNRGPAAAGTGGTERP